MSIEGVFKFNKDVMEDNAEAAKKLFEVNSRYLSECISLAQEAQEKLGGATTASGVMEVQKDYSKGLWEASKANYQANSDIMKDSYKTAGESMKNAFEYMKDFMPVYAPAESKVPAKPTKAAGKAANS